MNYLSKDIISGHDRLIGFILVMLFLMPLLYAQEADLPGTVEEDIRFELLPVELIGELKDKLRAKDQELQDREEDLQRREKAVREKELALMTLMEELMEIRRFIEREIAKQEAIDQEELRQLTSLYEQMRPRNAAVSLQSLYNKDPGITVTIIKKMQALRAGKIMDALSQIDPDMVAEISKAIGSSGF